MTIKTFFRENPLVSASFILALAFITCAGIAGYTAFRVVTADDVIEVTGSAKVPVQADFARWSITLSTETGLSDQQVGYNRLEEATTKIRTYFEQQGLTSFETPSPTTNPVFFYPQNAEPIQTGYEVTRSFVVSSDDVAKLTGLSNNIEPLIGDQYSVSSNGIELTYQKLPETRVTLLSEAITDAKARAESIAKESGKQVGELRSATGGVVQVLPEGGVEVSDYGTYDTTNVNKEVMVTIRATFSLE